MDLAALQKQIIAHPLFQKLSTVVENNAWHHNESVYDHSLKTAQIAKERLTADFIKNPTAKKYFQTLITKEIHGTSLGNLMYLIALLHDCGKILTYFEGNGPKPILMTTPVGNTSCPGHDYWGGRLVIPVILKDISLPADAKQFIGEVIKIHDTFNDGFFLTRKDWPLASVIENIKALANGYYEEALFNIYCDNYTADPSKDSIKKIEAVFNDPTFYEKRKYILP